MAGLARRSHVSPGEGKEKVVPELLRAEAGSRKRHVSGEQGVLSVERLGGLVGGRREQACTGHCRETPGDWGVWVQTGFFPGFRGADEGFQGLE